MQLSESQVASIVRDVLAQMGGTPAAAASSGEIPKTAKVAMLTGPKTIEVKEYPLSLIHI